MSYLLTLTFTLLFYILFISLHSSFHRLIACLILSILDFDLCIIPGADKFSENVIRNAVNHTNVLLTIVQSFGSISRKRNNRWLQSQQKSHSKIVPLDKCLSLFISFHFLTIENHNICIFLSSLSFRAHKHDGNRIKQSDTYIYWMANVETANAPDIVYLQSDVVMLIVLLTDNIQKKAKSNRLIFSKPWNDETKKQKHKKHKTKN